MLEIVLTQLIGSNGSCFIKSHDIGFDSQTDVVDYWL